jgi:Glycoside Hydrolase Family 113
MRWARSWILCASFYYPALWLAASCIWAFPGLVRSTFLGEHIVELRPTAFGLMLWGAPSNPADHPGASRAFFPSSPSLWILLPLAAGVAIALVRAGLVRHVLGGLVVAVLANVALVLPFTGIRGSGHVSVPLIVSSAFFFALMCLGLRWMSVAWAGRRYWERLAGLWACAAFMPLLLWFLFRLLQASRFGNFIWMLAPPAAVASALASLRTPESSAADPQPVASRAIISGAAATLLLAAGTNWGGPMVFHAFQQRQLRANQEELAALPPIPVKAPYAKVFFQRGISFSAEFPNPYASAGARQMLRALHADGVDAVALVPYGGMQLGSPEVRGFGEYSWESDEGLRELSRLGHAIGMKVLLKPGIWVRGHFGGDIDFASEADREKWFENYCTFIEHYARLAAEIHADMFCVGGEFIRMSRYDEEWRRLIANVRSNYPGPVTYAANFGEEFQNLKFWDALDYIGLQEYYPLPNDLSTTALVKKVEVVQERFNKPVIFTEVGFPSVAGGNRRPWADGKRGEVDLELQARCYQALFQAFYDKPWFQGMYWWKVGSNGFGGPGDTSLTPWDKPAMQVISDWYHDGSR